MQVINLPDCSHISNQNGENDAQTMNNALSCTHTHTHWNFHTQVRQHHSMLPYSSLCVLVKGFLLWLEGDMTHWNTHCLLGWLMQFFAWWLISYCSWFSYLAKVNKFLSITLLGNVSMALGNLAHRAAVYLLWKH